MSAAPETLEIASPRLLTFAPDEGLALVRPLIPAGLVPAAAQKAVDDFVAGAPAMFQWAVLETRPASEPGAVDYLACVIGLPGVREAVEQARRTSAPWTPVESRGAVLDAWCAGALEGVEVVWFEWDAPFSRAEPFLLPFLDPTFWGPAHARPSSPKGQVERLREIERLERGKTDDVALAEVERAFERLRGRGRALAAASLAARGGEGYRIFVEVAPERLLPWLEDIGWPGDRDLIRWWLPRIVSPWEQVFVQLEVGRTVRDYLGLEPEQTKRGAFELAHRRRSLETAARAGRIDAKHIPDILGWIGRTPIDAPGSRGAGILDRCVHFKFVFRNAALSEVKAYLGWCVELSSRTDR